MKNIEQIKQFHKEGYEFSIAKAKSFQKVAELSASENEFAILYALHPKCMPSPQ